MTRTNIDEQSALIARIFQALLEAKRKSPPVESTRRNKESSLAFELRGRFSHIKPGKTMVRFNQDQAYALVLCNEIHHPEKTGRESFSYWTLLEEGNGGVSYDGGRLTYTLNEVPASTSESDKLFYQTISKTFK